MIIGKSLTALGGGGLKPEIIVTAKAGALLNLHYKDSTIILKSYQLGADETQHTFVVNVSETAYIVEDATNSASIEVLVDAVAVFNVKIDYSIPASEFAVGSVVKLIENNSPIEYIVVNQGIPSNSSLYDSSCNGTWLLRKNIYTTGVYETSSSKNNYNGSTVDNYLRSTVLNLFDASIREKIKTVKIPYYTGKGGSVQTGSGGLSTKIFLLSGYEVGFTTGSTYLPHDGDCLSYFNGASDSSRIGYLNGTATRWWLRTGMSYQYHAFMVSTDGRQNSNGVFGTEGIRPALVMFSDTLFDEDTLICKGVS